MYKDIVIKKRAWIDEDRDIWNIFDVDEPIEFESTIVDFNGRIPVEDGVIVGEWMTNGIQLIKADMGELLSGGEGKIQSVRIDSIENLLYLTKTLPYYIIPIGIYEDRYTTAIKFSNGTNTATIDLKYFQYVYDGCFDYELSDDMLLLKRDGLACGAISGMDWNNMFPIWERPYSLADVEALSTIQGDPA